MNRLLLLASALVGATAAFADFPSASIDLGGNSTAANVVAYSSIAGPYAAFAAGTGSLGNDDYQADVTIMAGKPKLALDSLRFVGGVNAVNGILDFFFLDSANSNVLQSFSLQLPQAGNFIWNITGLGGMEVDPSGRLQIQARTGSMGQWFLTTTAPSVGTNNVAVGTGSGLNPQQNNAFELTGEPVPEPTTLAVLGMGVAALARRRRSK